MLIDVTITGDQSNGRPGHLNVLHQGAPKHLTWESGAFKVQTSCFVNVLEHAGAIEFLTHWNINDRVKATGAMLGEGWTWLHESRTGFRNRFHHMIFWGQGRMKVALALPYWSTGDHGDAFVWAGAVGRYTHSDYLPQSRDY